MEENLFSSEPIFRSSFFISIGLILNKNEYYRTVKSDIVLSTFFCNYDLQKVVAERSTIPVLDINCFSSLGSQVVFSFL